MTSPTDAAQLPTYADVIAAAERLAPVAVRTPLLACPALDALTGGRIFLKPEPLQRTGSFKFRGAYNRISRIPEAERAGGVVACSSGNHAQGVAAAATMLGMRSVIVMPSDAPALKRTRTLAFGAEVVSYERGVDDRDAIAHAIATERGATFVAPYDDRFVMAGQGTVGLEIAQDMTMLGLAPDVVIANASGGGLASGIALAVKEAFPHAQIYTAEPAGFDDHARSFQSGRRESNAQATGSFCDALLAATPGALTFQISSRIVGNGVAASDAEVARAVAFAFEEAKIVVEPGGAVALAAVLAGRLDLAGKTAAIVLSGGNVDAATFATCLTMAGKL
ncbi:threonine/serine dehydratase [Ancylobacter sp. 6x-1]|uniref:Threonine/serine dehydratase n=1 Tax=Ancylobacter crimeensis TaxID=2579147 RepID=A0ABT0DAC2_9HYPH|nr:threonine/serine dehydratase [Ancylobacter crimeensis]MCK0196854.1 threonine/serine dehydratase [Ancylobacter crimeensis]